MEMGRLPCGREKGSGASGISGMQILQRGLMQAPALAPGEKGVWQIPVAGIGAAAIGADAYTYWPITPKEIRSAPGAGRCIRPRTSQRKRRLPGWRQGLPFNRRLLLSLPIS